MRETNYHDVRPDMSSSAPSHFDALLRFTPLDAHTQRHLARVYTALTTAIAAAALGAGLQVYTRNAIPQLLCSLASFAAVVYFAMLPYATTPHRKRNIAMHAAAFATGTSVGGLVSLAIDMAEWAVPLALVLTATLFGSFSVAALTSKRRSFLYLGGVLGAALSMCFWVGLLGMFYPNSFSLGVQLYLGLLVFSGYVVYDTQVIVEKFATNGERDYLRHAFQLFQNFVAIFVRILIIIIKSKVGGDKNDRRRRRR